MLQKQNSNKAGNSPVKEVESINGYYKKVVMDDGQDYLDEDNLAGSDDNQALSKKEIFVTKRDGSKEPYNADKINKALEQVASGVDDPVGKVVQIATETELAVFSGITTEELDQAIINTAVQNIKEDPDFDIMATRLLLKTIYKKALGDYSNQYELEKLYRENFPAYIKKAVDQKLLDPRLFETYDLEKLSHYLDPKRDELLKYIGLNTMMKRYMVRDRNQVFIETPQYFWMRVAMGLSLNEEDPNVAAKSFYEKMSNLEYIAGGSTLVNVGTPHPTLSNCYLLEMHDSIDHIAKTVGDVMKLSKATGGIGLGVTKLRAEGSPIKSNNTFSSGPIPFMHTIDSTLRAVSRAGKKMGALCFYMENWHLNFQEFVDLRQNAGDEYRRTRTANTAVYISDEFMKRVKENADWYLFDPADVPDLNELYGAEFSKRYNEYIKMAEEGKITRFKKIKAREQFRFILITLQTTSHPWLTWKDAINVRALNNNTGTIHLSNLCTEITLPQDKENIAVCNLASINLSRHISNKDIDWHTLELSVRLAVRQLDNLLDINLSPVPEAAHSDDQNRAIGLGLMGFTDTVEKLGIPYESDQAYNLIDRVMEFISYKAIEESADLARERGSYPNFAGSGWSKGEVPIDTIKKLKQSRGEEVTVKHQEQLTLEIGNQLDWDALRERVKGGMRNATLMAIAPTASIGLVAGTTPGIDPQFAQMFSRSTNSGKYLEVNVNLVNDLKKRDLWETTKNKILERYGDVSEIEEIPQDVKKLYKTSFQVDPNAFIEVAARAQKWIDQAISRNMYLSTRDIEEMMQVYINAWQKGLKTTYYLHMQPRHKAEQSTTRVNKSESIGKKGFGMSQSQPTPVSQPIEEVPQPEKSPSPAPISAPVAPISSSKPAGGGFAKAGLSQGNSENLPKKSGNFGFGNTPESSSGKHPEKITEKQPQNEGQEFQDNAKTGFAKTEEQKKDLGVGEDELSASALKHNSTFGFDPFARSEKEKQAGPVGRGFANVADSSNINQPKSESSKQDNAKKSADKINPDACPIDPQERLQCESCQ